MTLRREQGSPTVQASEDKCWRGSQVRRAPSTTPAPQLQGGLGRCDVLEVVEEAPDDLGAAREHLNLFFDVAEPTAQLGCNGGAGSQRTVFRGTGQHCPDE